MFLLGIHIGEQTTSASYIHTDDGRVRYLHILDGDSPSKCQVESAVCRDLNSGRWRLVSEVCDYASASYTAFSGEAVHRMSSSKKEAFAAFVVLVFNHILSNHSELEYDSSKATRNFKLLVSFPARWVYDDPRQIDEYRDFLAGLIPIDGVVNDRVASLAHLRALTQKVDRFSNILFVDVKQDEVAYLSYGYKTGKSLFYTTPHGDRTVPLRVYNYFSVSDPVFREAQKAVADYCKMYDLDWTNAVLHYIREQIDAGYKDGQTAFFFDLSNRAIVPFSKSRIFDACTLERSFLENDLLISFRQVLKEGALSVRKHVGNPDVIVLRGTGSRMEWMQMLFKEVFAGAELVCVEEPAYVVSDGIVLYEYEKIVLKSAMSGFVYDFWKENTDATFEALIDKVFGEEVGRVKLPEILKMCGDYVNGDLMYQSTNTGHEGMETMTPGTFCTAVFYQAIKRLNVYLRKDRRNAICEAMDRANGRLRMEVLQLLRGMFEKSCFKRMPDDFTSISFASVDFSQSFMVADSGVQLISELTNGEFGDFLMRGDIYKDRPMWKDRRRFANTFYAYYESHMEIEKEDRERALSCIKTGLKAMLKPEIMLKNYLNQIYK